MSEKKINPQMPLFFQEFEDALRAIVMVLGGPKKVGPAMRGEAMPARTAERWVEDCLNPDRAERFHPGQVLWLLAEARRVGFHQAMDWVCDEVGYVRAEPLDPVDEHADLVRREEALVGELKQLLERRERLSVRPPLSSVRK